MATDIAAIVRNLEAFYPFKDKAVLHVGAGGGQFIGYAVHAKRVVGVDPDPEAVDRLKTAVRDKACGDCWYNCRGEVEMLYDPVGIWRSLPDFFLNRARPYGTDSARSNQP